MSIDEQGAPAQTATPAGPAGDPEDVLGRRIAAAVVDLVLLLALMFAIGAVPGLGDVEAEGGSISTKLTGAGTVLFGLLALAYYFGCEATTGRTLGKQLLGLRVVDADGERATPRAIAVRTVLRAIDGLPVFYLVGFITMLSAHPRNRRIGDLAAKTKVVRG